MKAIALVVLISLISISFAQPNLDGSWVSDTCEPSPAQSSKKQHLNQYYNIITILIKYYYYNLANYFYVRNYTFDGTTIHLETKIYSSNCQINNIKATIVAEGIGKSHPPDRGQPKLIGSLTSRFWWIIRNNTWL